MYGKLILSIPLLTSKQKKYRKKRERKIKRNIDLLLSDKTDNETIKLLSELFNRQNPYCYPYNVISGFAEVWIDYNDVLICFILNGDGRKNYNRNGVYYRTNIKKFYPPSGHVHGGHFKQPTNIEIQNAMIKALKEIINLLPVGNW